MARTLTIRWTPGTQTVSATVEYSFVTDAEAVFEIIFSAPSEIPLDIPDDARAIVVRVYPYSDHWPAAQTMIFADAQQAQELTVECAQITDTGPLGWWHDAIGICSSNPMRGAGIRIGVIDDYIDTSIAVFGNVEDLGHAAKGRVAVPAYNHGASVISLITAKTPHARFEGVAPGASVSFISAQSLYAKDRLSPNAMAAAIDRLADDEDCNLINISAGDSKDPQPYVLEAVQRAEKLGCLCIFPGGNKPGKPLHPACYDDVLAVGAFGKVGYAPGSLFADAGATATLAKSSTYYMLERLAFGAQLTCASPGIGLVAGFDGRVFPLSGTSFAAPIACGVLAVRLAADKKYKSKIKEERASHARAALEKCLRPCGFPDPAHWLRMPKVTAS